MTKSAYIHIPFCKSKCKYCSFISFNRLDKVDEYIKALHTEIEAYYEKENLKTLYLGGGTPSLISPDKLGEIVSAFKFAQSPEITCEINPDDADFEYLKELKSIGINRLSIGSQSFDDNILHNIGRRHNSQQIVSAVQNAQKVGFDNISLDLIYGLPYQTDIKPDLENFLKLGIQHISTYGLKIDEGSFWYKNPPTGLPDDDLQADIYEGVNNKLKSSGFHRYEISNFALEGFESKHNLNYWNNNEYYGFGVAAHGYRNKIRYFNTSELDEYINNPTHHKNEKNLTLKEILEEEIFLGFRKTEGINVEEINTKFNIDFNNKYSHILAKYKDYILPTKKGWQLNLQGILLSNIILSEFIED